MIRSAKLLVVGAALKSYLSSGKSSAIAFSLRAMSFHCISTFSDAVPGGFGAASFLGISCARAEVISIPAAKIIAAKQRAVFMDRPPWVPRHLTGKLRVVCEV